MKQKQSKARKPKVSRTAEEKRRSRILREALSGSLRSEERRSVVENPKNRMFSEAMRKLGAKSIQLKQDAMETVNDAVQTTLNEARLDLSGLTSLGYYKAQKLLTEQTLLKQIRKEAWLVVRAQLVATLSDGDTQFGELKNG